MRSGVIAQKVGMTRIFTEAGEQVPVAIAADRRETLADSSGRIVGIANRLPRPGGTDQRLSLTSAIDKYTSGPAYASFDDREKGTLTPGMLADIVILATNVFARPPAVRADVAVKVTIFDGKIVYRAK